MTGEQVGGPRLIFRNYAPQGTSFAEGAFDRAIGRDLDFRVGDEVVGRARLLRADVQDNGSSIEFEVQAADGFGLRFDLPTEWTV